MLLRSKTWIVPLCLILTLGLIYFPIWLRGELPINTALLILAAITVLAWLVKRGWLERSRLPKTGLEIPIFIFLSAALVSLILSPALRIGLEKMAWYAFGGLLFYLLVDVFEHPSIRSGFRVALFIATATVLLSALLETYAHYLLWWEQVGSRSIMPPFQIRFNSLIGHSNTFMMLMNLVAPIALVTFLSTGRRAERVLAAGWLVMYAFALPFSSSRGGWLGAAAWMGAMGLLWLAAGGRWRVYWAALRKRLALTVTGGLAILVLGGLAAVRFYLVFAGSHPTHGSGFSLNRESIWASVIEIWKASPWLGSGVGQLFVELLRVTRAFPAGWWPFHAHSTPLQILGETGIIGFLACLLLVGTAVVFLVRAYRAAPAAERPWMAASLAALSSAAVHGFFDDYTGHPLLLILPVVHVAFVIAASGKLDRFKRLPLFSLAIPWLAVAAVAFVFVWGGAPHYSAVSRLAENDWLGAAQTSAKSVRRDPAMPYYHTQVALAYAQAWQESANPDHLEKARQYLENALAIEPNNSVLWADLAVLNWHTGQPDEAFRAIRRAIMLCPEDADYYIQQGWFFEQEGQASEARSQYRQALTLNPELSNHPFWTASEVRREAAGTATNASLVEGGYWRQAQEALVSGDFAEARYELAVSGLSEETPAAITSTWADLMSQQGDLEETRQLLENLANTVDLDYWGKGGGSYYSRFVRPTYPLTVVPGMIQVNEDFGQFENLQMLLDLQLAAGECEEATFTWQVLQREIHAGELIPGGYPPMPACPATLQGGT